MNSLTLTLLALFITAGISIREVSALPSNSKSPIKPVVASSLTDLVTWGGNNGGKLYGEVFNIDRRGLLKATSNSLKYIRSQKAAEKYRELSIPGINPLIIEASLLRFRELLLTSKSDEAFLRHLENDYVLFKPSGNIKEKAVKFTGYFQPTYKASRKRTVEYRFPIYGIPEDFDPRRKGHPTRVELEGYDGLGKSSSAVNGKELAFLRSRWEAFMIHVQGSALLELEEGGRMSVGFAAGTNYPFRGISKSFMQRHKVAWSRLGSFFEKHPHLLNEVLAKNNRFIFFQENKTTDPIGSLGVPVTAECSIATDKNLFPPGALGLISVALPKEQVDGTLKSVPVAKFVLDQDTGSAIRGQARVDVFMGSGNEGQKKANYVYNNGDLYYLILKEEGKKNNSI